MVMHPRPISDTSRPWLPSFRFCIVAIPSIALGGRRSGSAAILLVADLFHPVDVVAVERFRNCDMRHRSNRRRAVPVLLTGGKPNDIARTNFLDRSILALNPAKAGRDDEGLTERMGV